MAKFKLAESFMAKYDDFPTHMTELGKFVYYRTYSRYLPALERRETWKETVKRAVEFNIDLARQHTNRNGYRSIMPALKAEAEELFDNIFNLRMSLSGRTLWVGGAETGVGDKYALANYNCSYLAITKWEDFGDMFYLLMVGTGVGFRATKQMANDLPSIRTDVEVIHEPYTQRYPLVKIDTTEKYVINDGKKIVVHIGDSKEGWVDALRLYFDVLTKEEFASVEQIGFYYDYIRPRGSRLKTFGGTASGHEPLREMFEGIAKVIRNEIDDFLAPLERDGDNRVKLRPVHLLDIGNLIGNNVVVGGVRRTAEIFLFDEDDYESMFAKYGINGIWDIEKHEKVIALLRENGQSELADKIASLPTMDADARPLHHRRMSNNSVAFTEQPSDEKLRLIFEMLQGEGEPGFLNLREMATRRFKAMGIDNPTEEMMLEMMKRIGMNPCAEIILDSYGVCNLTTVNVVAFVDDNGVLDLPGLMRAQELSARAGLRMTLAELEIAHWDTVQQRDRLLGVSFTGYQDAMAQMTAVKYGDGEQISADEETYGTYILDDMKWVVREAADKYAKELRVSAPLLTTTVKPEGTISQVFGGVSSGVHFSHSPFYIRRVRISATDPLAKAMSEMGYEMKPEVGQTKEDARTLVIEFPVASGAKRTKDDVDAREQMEIYFDIQEHYTEHNASNTIHVRPDEWDTVREIIADRWDAFSAVSFLPYDGGGYELAPFEAITKEQYESMKANLPEFDIDILSEYENGELLEMEDNDPECVGGVCPVR